MRSRYQLTLASLLMLLALPACSKTEAPTADTVPSATVSGASVAPAPASASAAAPPDTAAAASAPASAASAPAAGTAAAATSGNAPAPKASAAASAGPPNCGTKPLPDCPLQAWMKANAGPAMSAGDMPALATALTSIATMAPPGYTNWASISKDGAKAAQASNTDGVKASCRSCHEQYKAKYKTEMRTRAVP